MGNQVFLCGCPFLNSSTQVSFLVCVLFVKPMAWDQSQGLDSRGRGRDELEVSQAAPRDSLENTPVLVEEKGTEENVLLSA